MKSNKVIGSPLGMADRRMAAFMLLMVMFGASVADCNALYATIFTKDGVRYTVRDESNAGKPTADLTPAGAQRPTLKIRYSKP